MGRKKTQGAANQVRALNFNTHETLHTLTRRNRASAVADHAD